MTRRALRKLKDKRAALQQLRVATESFDAARARFNAALSVSARRRAGVWRHAVDGSLVNLDQLVSMDALPVGGTWMIRGRTPYGEVVALASRASKAAALQWIDDFVAATK